MTLRPTSLASKLLKKSERTQSEIQACWLLPTPVTHSFGGIGPFRHLKTVVVTESESSATQLRRWGF